MAKDLNLEALLGKPKQKNSAEDDFSPAIKAMRRSERTSRNGVARGMALRALANYYTDEYEILRDQALKKVNAERGPLPGDQGYDSSRVPPRQRERQGRD